MILLLIILLLCSAYFSASEMALFSLSVPKVKSYQISTMPRQRLIASLLSKPRDLIVTIFMLNTLVNILIQNTTSNLFGETANWLFKVGVPFVLMLFLGEIIPKNFGIRNNVRLSALVAPSIAFFQKLLSPLRSLVVAVTVPVSRALFFYLRPDKSISKQELKHVLKTSQEHGVLHPDEAELVRGVLKLQDATVKSLMRPREDILYDDTSEPLSKLAYLFAEQQCSRIPICKDTLDHILGILTVRQFVLHCRHVEHSDRILPFLSPPLYVPENMSARLLFKRFNQELALVVDEYGAISGLITQEDLVEQVVGEIADSRDTKALFTKAGPHEIIASGRMELAALNEYFGVNLSSSHDMVTIGGWLSEKYGDIPPSGTKVEYDNLLFHVLSADPNRIRRLYIRKQG